MSLQNTLYRAYRQNRQSTDTYVDN